MVLRFGILTYVLTAAAPAAAPDRVLRSVFNTVLKSGREGRARQFQHVLSARRPKPQSQHQIQYRIQYFNKIASAQKRH